MATLLSLVPGFVDIRPDAARMQPVPTPRELLNAGFVRAVKFIAKLERRETLQASAKPFRSKIRP